MKPELVDHRKFLRLKRLLGEPTPHVIGYLMLMWRRGYQTGNPLLGDELDVEAAAEYLGEPRKFATAAHESGFLDRTEDGQLCIFGYRRYCRMLFPPRTRRIDLYRKAWKVMRARVLAEDGPICHYCGVDCSDDPTVDHIVSVANGGQGNRENLVVSCRPCNSRKGAR